MAPLDTPKLLVPVDVSTDALPGDGLADFVAGIDVVLMGYFTVPDQSLPAQLKLNRGEEAEARLDHIAEQMRDSGVAGTVETELVFTHDRRDPIDRIADEHACDGVLVPGETGSIERVLVPLRGDVNLDRILLFAGAVAQHSGASIALFHAVTDDDQDGETLLETATEQLTAGGLDDGQITRRVSEGGDSYAQIVERGSAFDLIVLGESEPSLRERIFGSTPEKITDQTNCSVVVVRDPTA
jgi:Universal stress protein UspA and related nucleotide-binding proteins